jgi:6-phosphogluconolactonase (cycloisomerase 2 family)
MCSLIPPILFSSGGKTSGTRGSSNKLLVVLGEVAVQNKTGPSRAGLAIGVVAALLYTLACGVRSMPQNNYLYVGEVFVPPVSSVRIGSVAQFRVGTDGTLTALTSNTIHSVIPFFAAAVAPSRQHLFILNGAISEFGIGSDGILTPNTAPAANGSSLAFTPNGEVALIANPTDATLGSYTLSSSGALTPVNSVATGGFPQYTVVDGWGKFAYVTSWNDHTVSEYTISESGILTPNGSILTGGHNPRALVVSPKGFLYCANVSSRSVTEFSIDASTGGLTRVNYYPIWVKPKPGPLWISFDPTGTYAYVGNLDEIAQFTVDGTTGALARNGTIIIPNGALGGGVDSSGRFVFTAGVDGTISQFIISSNGRLVPNGWVSLGENMVGETLAFAQR